MNTNQGTVKASLWYIVSNVILNGLNFLVVPVFSRILSQREFGEYNNIVAWVGVLTYIGTLFLASALPKGLFDFKDDRKSFIWSLLILGTLYTGVIFGVVITKQGFFMDFFSVDKKYIYIIFCYLLVYPAYVFFTESNRLLFKYKVCILFNYIVVISSIVLSLVLVSFFDDVLLGRVIGMYIPVILLSVVIYVYYGVKGKQVKIKYWKYALPISIPLAGHLIAGNLLSSSDRIMIKHYWGADATAIYSMAYNCALIFTIINTSMNSAITPWLNNCIQHRENKKIREVSKIYVIIIIGIALLMMLIAPEVLYIMGGQKYYQAKEIIPFVVLAYVLDAICGLYTNYEQFIGKTYTILAGTVTAAIVNFVLNYLLLPIWGFQIAAVTTIIGYLVMLLVHVVYLNKIEQSDIYNIVFIGKMIGIAILCTGFCLFLYTKFMFRILVCVLYIVMIGYYLLMNKNILMGLMRNSKNE